MKRLCLLKLCAAIALPGTAASAAVVTFTSTGYITEGFDAAGLFGNPFTSLVGAMYVVTQKIDVPSLYIYRGGNLILRPESKMISNLLTINNHDFLVEHTDYDTGRVTFQTSGNQVYFDAYTSRTIIDQDDHAHVVIITKSIGVGGAGSFNLVDLSESVSISVAGADLSDSYGTFWKLQTRVDDNVITHSVPFTATPKIDRIDVSVVGQFIRPVPEPATWLLLIAGFGVIGTQLRRRRGSELDARPKSHQ